jgi:hypothetical protein
MTIDDNPFKHDSECTEECPACRWRMGEMKKQLDSPKSSSPNPRLRGVELLARQRTTRGAHATPRSGTRGSDVFKRLRIEDRSRRKMAEDEAALVNLYGRETFEQRRARYAKAREAYVQAAKDRLGRIKPLHHDHDTWGGCYLCLWYEVYPDGNGPSVNQDRSGEGL